MAIQECALSINGEAYGVALVCTTTGLPLPLPLSRSWLTDLDDATAFLEWHERCQGIDLRSLDATELNELGKEWSEGDREKTRCAWEDCDARQNGAGLCDDHEREHELRETGHDIEWFAAGDDR